MPWRNSKPPTLDELTQILDAEGRSWAEFTDAPGTKYGRHKHEFDDFVMIVSGRMRIGTDTKAWELKAGDRLNIPAKTAHWAEVIGKAEVRYLSAGG